jgi:hypothetical protein
MGRNRKINCQELNNIAPLLSARVVCCLSLARYYNSVDRLSLLKAINYSKDEGNSPTLKKRGLRCVNPGYLSICFVSGIYARIREIAWLAERSPLRLLNSGARAIAIRIQRWSGRRSNYCYGADM